MRKLFLSASLALSMVAMAQHVTPVNIEIAEVRLDSLRALYMSEPTMYRASLDVVSQALAKNAEEIKDAKAILKVEQTHISPNLSPPNCWLNESKIYSPHVVVWQN